jgi:signal transduction histidine kinase
MNPILQDIRLVKRAYWLIKLRWIAIAGVVTATFFAGNVLGVSVQHIPLYGVAAALVLHNIISLLLLRRALNATVGNLSTSIRKIINVQISVDLLALTALLHYSGGIENPFVIYFIFHMVIASILLSPWESYLQATFAVCLLTFMALLEYRGIVSHHCLKAFVLYDIHTNGLCVFGVVSVLASAFYLTIYMTSSISRQLRQQDRVKDEYVSRVTHDIKGHLASVHSCLDVVVREVVGSLDERQSDFIGRAHERTRKLTNFVRTLLRLTEMRLSDKLEMDVFSLENALFNVVDNVKTKAEDKSITLNCNFQLSADGIFGNQFSIEEVITNLVLNAIKYTPANGAVRIIAKDHGSYRLVEIADTGIGIPEDELGFVFDEFYRATNARKVEKDGTGLGLSIAKEIVQKHGGKIWADTRKGGGTKFSLTLPMTNSS